MPSQYQRNFFPSVEEFPPHKFLCGYYNDLMFSLGIVKPCSKKSKKFVLDSSLSREEAFLRKIDELAPELGFGRECFQKIEHISQAKGYIPYLFAVYEIKDGLFHVIRADSFESYFVSWVHKPDWLTMPRYLSKEDWNELGGKRPVLFKFTPPGSISV